MPCFVFCNCSSQGEGSHTSNSTDAPSILHPQKYARSIEYIRTSSTESVAVLVVYLLRV